MNNLYKEKSELMWQLFGKSGTMVLATSADDIVTARTVSGGEKDGKIYFTTFSNSNKYVQLKANPNVALCVDAVQIVGTAKDLGHPLTEENKAGAEVVKARFPEWFDEYCAAPIAVLIEVTPKKCGFGILETNEMYALDFAAETASEIKI